MNQDDGPTGGIVRHGLRVMDRQTRTQHPRHTDVVPADRSERQSARTQVDGAADGETVADDVGDEGGGDDDVDGVGDPDVGDDEGGGDDVDGVGDADGEAEPDGQSSADGQANPDVGNGADGEGAADVGGGAPDGEARSDGQSNTSGQSDPAGAGAAMHPERLVVRGAAAQRSSWPDRLR
jgi:hypothetical protein